MNDDLTFWKYEGLGNDFVLVTQPVGADAARKLCDRKLGIGGDGVLEVTVPGPSDTTAAVHVWNSDGSPAEICGNGLRCVTLHLAEKGVVNSTMLVGTGAGPRRCVLVQQPRPGSAIVRVEMGRARLERRAVPAAGSGRMIDEEVDVDGTFLRCTAVGMGNPHAVTFDSATLAEVRTLGPCLEHHDLFPEGVNVGFAEMVAPDEIRLTVWERGAGLTGACGSGACAAAVAACVTERAPFDVPLHVEQPGGRLTITVDHERHVTMEGPARRVFEGRIGRSKNF